jgi:predicted butyrate kinase (DUF1464 family)
MTRVVGIDPGTVSIDVCGIDEGRLYLDRSLPTEQALANPDDFIELLTAAGVPDLVAGPSGYGLPLLRSVDATDADLRLAFLAAPEEPGGLGGLRSFARRLGASGLPVMYTPGVIHLDTVPKHRKLNRVDMGTADKLCAVVLGLRDHCVRRQRTPAQASFILLELGGAFTAGVAVENGQVVDGIGGTSGPIGWRAAGALDGEVAFLAGTVSKADLFQGGVSSLSQRDPASRSVAVRAYVEGAAKTVRQLRCSAPTVDEVLLSGRKAAEPEIFQWLSAELRDVGIVRLLTGFAVTAKQGAQGAAQLVDRLRIREAKGSVLDHLLFISPTTARRRLGIPLND